MSNKERFLKYLQTCVKSTRATESNPLLLGGNAPKDYARFLEPDRLFDYNPSKWAHIGSMYNINDYYKALEVFNELIADEAFLQRDKNDNQGWRRGAISHYVCFLNAQEFFTNNDSGQDAPSFANAPVTLPLQQIYYGAPGTGKTHEINEQTKGQDVIRTTFHPDSDYSTFVGAYKPTSTEIPMRDVTGRVIKDANGEDVKENRIIYEFVDQAFLQAYIKAWRAVASAAQDEEPKKQYLVIEEINRGNCAQIFGDLFQLLDRNAWGFSEYPIKADNDMKKQLQKAFKGLSIAQAEGINALFDGKDIVKDVLNGECLLLPNNLYIWATMNTSDQSLFPIDSAFKRRWDWRYMPIDTAKEFWKIRVNGSSYSWTSFLNIINEIVHDKTQSEDKQLGFYFCKAREGVIDAETFVGKVLFYLWNDVFKDYGFDDDFFEDEKLPDGTFKPLAFKSFYDVKTRKVIESQAEKFLLNLKVERIEDEDKEEEDGNE